MSEGVDLWYVKLASGDVHRVTLDQLDGAFQAGHIDERTMVLASDAADGTAWTSLGDLLGLDEPAQTGAAPAGYAPVAAQPQVEAHQPAPQYQAPVAQYQAPVAQYQAPVAQYQAPVAQYQAPVAQYQAPVAQYHAPVAQYHAPVAQYQASAPQYQQAPQYQPVQAAPAASVAPRAYAAPAYAQPAVSVMPSPVRSVTPPPVAYAPRSMPPAVANSLRPMSMDLGTSDLDDMPFQRKSRKGWAVLALGVAAAAGVAGFFSTRAHSGGDDITTVAAAAAMAAPQSYATPLPATPPPAPAPAYVPTPSSGTQAAPAEASPLNPQFTDRFNESQKQKLIAADKAREEKAKAAHSGGGYHPAKSSKSAFTKGGNKYDPLNSDL